MTAGSNQYRLLIVDDNEAIHNDLKKILQPRRLIRISRPMKRSCLG